MSRLLLVGLVALSVVVGGCGEQSAEPAEKPDEAPVKVAKSVDENPVKLAKKPAPKSAPKPVKKPPKESATTTKVQSYQIVSTRFNRLEAKVNAAIKDGWQPSGGLTCGFNKWHTCAQAMVKSE